MIIIIQKIFTEEEMIWFLNNLEEFSKEVFLPDFMHLSLLFHLCSMWI